MLDFYAAACRLHLAETLGPRLWRQILETFEFGVDVAFHGPGEQWMDRRRRRFNKLDQRLNHRIAVERTADDAGTDFRRVRGEDGRGSGVGRLIDPWIVDRDSHAFGCGRQATKGHFRARPVGGESRWLPRHGQCQRPVYARDQLRRVINLRGEGDVLGADGKWRLVAVDLRASLYAMRLDTERKAGDVLRAAGVDAPGRSFALLPAGERAIRLRCGVVPKPAPATDYRNQDKDGQDDWQNAAARRRVPPRRPPRCPLSWPHHA